MRPRAGHCALLLAALALGLHAVEARVQPLRPAAIEMDPPLPPRIIPSTVGHSEVERELRTLERLATSEKPVYAAGAASQARGGSAKSLAKPKAGKAQPAASAPAAAGGPGTAAWLLGLIHLHGAGVARDPVRAQQWFEAAWARGEPLAAAGMAWCLIDGCAGPPSPAAAQPWIDRLARANRGRALYLAWLSLTRQSPLVLAEIQNPRTGSEDPPLPHPELLLEAARLGDVHALIELGLDAASRRHWQQARSYFVAAAPKSKAAAANLEIIDMAQPRSAKSSEAAAAPGAAALAEARRAHRGEGMPADYAMAIRLYRQAQAEGNPEAQKMLALIFSRPTPTGEVDLAWMRQLAYVDVNSLAPSLSNLAGVRVMRREPTPLYDFLPPKWQQRTLAVAP
jgi:TPR repeat protein